jgi:hypothetical protein
VVAGLNVNEMYEALAIDDIQRTADLFRPVYERTDRLSGYQVSKSRQCSRTTRRERSPRPDGSGNGSIVPMS